jgi:two-component system NtrC family sensor kinase
MSVRARLLVIIAVVAMVPLVASAWTTLAGHQRAYDGALTELYAQTADHGAAVVDARVRIARQSIAPLAATIPWGTLDADERAGALRLVYEQDDDVSVVSMLDERGRSVGASEWVAPEAAEGSPHPPLTIAGLQAFSRSLAELWKSKAEVARTVATDGAPVLPLTFSIDPASGSAAAREQPPRGWLLAVGWSLRQTCAALGNAMPDGARARVIAGGVVLCGTPLAGGPPGTGERTSRYQAADGDVLAAASGVASVPGWTVVVERPAAAALAPSDALRRQAYTFIGVAALLALIAGLVLARGILRPLAGLTATARAVANRDFERRAPATRTDELGDLARAFNSMLDEIAGWNRELNNRVGARTRELRAAQDALLESRKLAAMASLGAGVAHELNNPLTSVLALCQVALQKARAGNEDPRRIELLATMEEECQRMREIVAKMQRLTTDYRNDGVAPVVAGDLFRDVIAARRDALAGITVEIDLAADLPRVLGHRGHLTEALEQLVDNAVTAMRGRPARKLRFVASSIEDELVKLAVADTGGGIPAAFIDKVFEPFSTTKSDWQRPGLGLATVHRIVDSHRGTIRVERSSAEGTEIVMYLPAVKIAHLA